MKKLITSFFISLFSIAVIVSFLHYPLFQLLPQMYLSHDDWILRLHFKLLGPHPYQEFFDYFKIRSAYFAYQTFYIGTLERLFGFDYQIFNIVNLTLKILATISVYPLILVSFRRKLLALLVTILFAINYNSAGTLEYITKGIDYLGLLAMNIFLTAYSYAIRNKLTSLKWYIFLSGLFVLAPILSPARLYSLLVIPLIIEIIRFMNNSISGLGNLFKSVGILYFPFLLVFLLEPQQFINIFTHTPKIINVLQQGLWYQILVPFSGLFLTLVPANIWGEQLIPAISSFEEFKLFLFSKPIFIFGISTFLIMYAKSRRVLKLSLLILLLNYFLDILVYLIFISITKNNLRSPINSGGLFIILGGVFVITVGFVFIWEWFNEKKKDDLHLALGIGPIFSLIFIFLTWFLADEHLSFGGLHYYLVVASLGSSLFIGSFIVSIYDKFNSIKRLKFLAPLIFFALFPLYLINSKTLYSYFDNVLLGGRGASKNYIINQQMQYFLDKYHINIENPSLFYFDVSNESTQDRGFYEKGFTSYFLYWMHLKDGYLKGGCVGVIPTDNLDDVKKLIISDGNRLYFRDYGSCVDTRQLPILDYNRHIILYKPENFYAFKLRNRQIIDIREKTFKALNLDKLIK